jgi:hypothetical protein
MENKFIYLFIFLMFKLLILLGTTTIVIQLSDLSTPLWSVHPLTWGGHSKKRGLQGCYFQKAGLDCGVTPLFRNPCSPAFLTNLWVRCGLSKVQTI